MAAVWYRFRAELRARWRAWLGLALLAGVAGGATIALAAGARRTETAYPRLVEAERQYDVAVFEGGFTGDVPTPPAFLDRVEGLPQVAESACARVTFDNGGRTDDGSLTGEPDYLQTITPADEKAAAVLARQKLLDGRHPDPAHAEEVAINFTVAERYELEVGEAFELEMFTEAEALAFAAEGAVTEGTTKRFRVVGIFAGAGDFPPRSLGDGAGSVNLTPAFAEDNPEFVSSNLVLAVRLEDGRRDLPAFRAGVERAARGVPAGAFDALGTFDVHLQHEATERAINLLTVALWILSALAAGAAVLIIGQALLRLTAIESVEHPALRAIGMTNRELAGLGLARGALVAGVGAVVSGAIAVALSPLFPLGLARTAEPDPGIRFDALAVLGGVAAVALAVGLLTALATWRVSRAARAAARRAATGESRVSGIGAALGRSGFSPPAVTGVRMALESGRGASAVPARTTLVGAIMSVVALAGALTFAAGLNHLVDTPRLYGWNWDATVGDGYGADVYDDVVPALADEPAVGAYGAGTFVSVTLDGREIFVLATDSIEGSVGPTVIEGEAPFAADEILLGTGALEAIDASIGDHVSVGFIGTFNGEATERPPTRRMRVVGRGVLPEQSDIGLDDAGAFTYDALERLDAEAARNFFPVRFADGVDRTRGLAAISGAVDTYTVTVQRPTDLVNFGRVDALPLVGAGVLALVATAMVTHLLVSSIRRRRRELALLKTLGFTGRQVSMTVGWQATTLALVAVAFGLPLGVAVGRWAWTVAAERLGVVVEPVVPVPALLLVVPIAVVAANLVAAAPAWLAGRTRPAVLLRAE